MTGGAGKAPPPTSFKILHYSGNKSPMIREKYYRLLQVKKIQNFKIISSNLLPGQT